MPTPMAVTLTVKLHDVFGESDAPDKLTVFDPAIAVGEAEHSLTRSLGVETSRPDGSVSVKPTPVKPVPLGLLIVKLKDVLPFRATLDVPNDLLMVGGEIDA